MKNYLCTYEPKYFDIGSEKWFSSKVIFQIEMFKGKFFVDDLQEN